MKPKIPGTRYLLGWQWYKSPPTDPDDRVGNVAEMIAIIITLGALVYLAVTLIQAWVK